ncbi:MAG: NAD(P)-dependent oxidoreductase [bacterium]|nr:NAD(P)-dependent oxidoreductase [bacterium]
MDIEKASKTQFKRSLGGKTLFITGASRGIGKAIALRAARDGANIIIAAKTTTDHPKLPGTIYSAAEEIEKAGGRALAVKTDIRFEEQVENAVNTGVEHFGGIDILVNNASAISLSGTLETPMKTYDRMYDINARGSFLLTQTALPHLLKSENAHVLNLSPPINLDPKWFEGHAAYTLAKYAMSFWVLGMSREFSGQNVAFNALWPCTAIATAAVRNLLGGEEVINASRKPEIMGQAAWYILTRDSRQWTGNFLTDEQVLAEEGETDLDKYAVKPGIPLFRDFFLD